ncbi:MAG: thiosulfate oxidation carrier complex protein SoxZ [Deinococcales bacterium]
MMNSPNILLAFNPRKAKPGEVIKVTLVVRHHMDHGLNLDIRGGFSLPDYIYDLQIYLGETLLSQFKLEGSVSSDPLLGFQMIAPDAPSSITVRYRDHAGERGEATFPLDVII